MKLLDLLKMANQNKQHIHRIPSNTKRGRQIASQAAPTNVVNVPPGQGNDGQSSSQGRKRAYSKRDI
jgi:hypothetical protein